MCEHVLMVAILVIPAPHNMPGARGCCTGVLSYIMGVIYWGDVLCYGGSNRGCYIMGVL